MFKITDMRGFQITYENGWTISVQFGPGLYCDNYGMRDSKLAGENGSKNAECAVISPSGKLFAHPSFNGDTVKGCMTPKEVLELMVWTEGQEVQA